VRRSPGGDPREVGASFARTELYFGTLKPDRVVMEAEFFDFLDDHVTPRFPAGRTVIRGTGRFRGADGLIVRENSFILVLLYPVDEYRQPSADIDAIRRLDRRVFQQESVLRVDDRSGSASRSRRARARGTAVGSERPARPAPAASPPGASARTLDRPPAAGGAPCRPSAPAAGTARDSVDTARVLR
jgi:hypothetical protein